ncbi:MAG: tRNA pseudouridine(13) synthase TruD [Anaerolineae bacterium]
MSPTDSRTCDFYWPCITAGLPGIGGELKTDPEDFFVEELPAYGPSGEGDHTFITVEKRGLNTLDVVRQLAAVLGIPARDIGIAGLKDRQSVARQRLSVPRIPPEQLRGLAFDGLRVLDAVPHPHKLRRGHLRGNRFRVRLRHVHPEAVERAPAILDVLTTRGVPNGFGPQRFGVERQNHLAGHALLHNDRAALKQLDVPNSRARRYRSLYLSAYQSHLFNRYLARRIENGIFDTVIAGDVAKKHDTGGLFIVENPEVEAPRATAFEISATGPIYGYRMMEARAEAGQIEQAILGEEGIMLESFRPARLKGTRRVLRWHPDDLTWELIGDDLILEFTAPKGAYATALLREVRKANENLPGRLVPT